MSTKNSSSQSELGFDAFSASGRVYTNTDDVRTGHAIRDDLRNSVDSLLITGFSSLQYMLSLLKDTQPSSVTVRVVIGSEDLHEEFMRAGGSTTASFEASVAEHWTKKGVSLMSAPAILNVLKLVESGRIRVRTLNRLHAKIYAFDSSVYIGSSNLSRSGMSSQLEANLRIDSSEADAARIRDVAEFYWDRATDGDDWFASLLQSLVRIVGWEEALARALAELLTSQWLKDHPNLDSFVERLNLWPSQRAAIGQALYIIDNHGALLVADPTGSGKSRLGAALQKILESRLLRERGTYDPPRSLVVCPPIVKENWLNEYEQLDTRAPEIMSHGKLQLNTEESVGKRSPTRQSLVRSDILFVDEAHNYLNKGSNRSRLLAAATPDYTLLFTATPINRTVKDVFRLIEILDIDNFSDPLVKLITKLRRAARYGRLPETSDIGLVLHNLTIRRTKDDLNRMIAREPTAYRDDRNRPCHYPIHETIAFELNEDEHDISVARSIIERASELKGLARLRDIKPFEGASMARMTGEDILNQHLARAKALASYQVLSRMRSSTAALIEHVGGTELAAERYGIEPISADNKNGNMLRRALSYAVSLPQIDDGIPAPSWLCDVDEYRAACEAEASTYEAILKLALSFHDSRELRKCRLLKEIIQVDERILSFDSRIITLQVLKKLLGHDAPTLVVTGTTGNQRQAQQRFGPFSDSKPLVGLCSDSMAEGVNLQGASAIVLLSLPSVMRIAEQRIGRVDRLNSPHERIRVYWPEDHPYFILDTDRKFYRTARHVDELLGSNIEIPASLTDRLSVAPVRRSGGVLSLASEKAEDMYNSAIQDAFSPLHELVYGVDPLVQPEVYRKYEKVTERVVSCVSVVQSRESFGFFALRGTEDLAPRWLLIDHLGSVMTDLAKISELLPGLVRTSERIEPSSELWIAAVQAATRKLNAKQIVALPNRLRRTLEVLQHCLKRDESSDLERRSIVAELKRALRITEAEDEPTIDYRSLANRALKLMQPYLSGLRENTRRSKFISINQLKKEFDAGRFHLATEDLAAVVNGITYLPPVQDRVVAAIIGAPQTSGV